MTKKDESISNFKFHLSERMNDMFIELIITKQILAESLKEDTNITDDERETLYHYYKELKEKFISEFKKNNEEKLKKYNQLMNE